MTREPIQNECRGTCQWGATEQLDDGLRIFACTGCGSEWTAREGWTPRNADGEVPAAVAAERALAEPKGAAGAPAPEPGRGGNGVGSW